MEEQESWLRQEGEPENHYAWFHCYLMLGEGRTLLAAYNQVQQQKGPRKSQKAQKGPERPTKSANLAECLPGSWKIVVRQWNWRERAQEWDREQQRLDGYRFEQCQKEVTEEALTLSKQMTAKAKRMLDWPLSRTTTSKDGKTITIEPTEWSQSTAVRMAKEGIALGRLATDLDDLRFSQKVAKQSDEEALANVLRELDALGYDVRKRNETLWQDDWDDEEEDDQPPVSEEEAKEVLKELGYLVVPPVHPGPLGTVKKGPFQS